MSLTIVPNLGAEEGPDWPRRLARPEVAAAAGLWRLLFGQDVRVEGLAEADAAWPEALGPAPRDPVFPWLPGGTDTGWLPWLATPDEVQLRGAPAAGPSPEAVAVVHDKAFAQRAAEADHFVPRDLRGAVHAFDPPELESPRDAAARIDAATAKWPASLGSQFVLKPRWGTSGRGHVTGRVGAATDADVVASLARLAARGGAILEPWLDRIRDLSTQLYVGPEGLVLLGELEQIVSRSGAIHGHRGEVDSRGRVASGCDEEEAVREAAVAVGSRAREVGFRGPCGVDAFTFRGEGDRPVVRPVVECNARFTMGTVSVGIVRRALPRLKAETGLQPGERRAFALLLDKPKNAATWDEVRDRCPAPHTLVPLAHPGAARLPALLVARDRAAIDAALATDA